MLSVAPDAHRFPPSQNIRVRSWFPTLSVIYVTDRDRRLAHNALTGGKTNSGKSLATRTDPVTRRSLISSGPRWSGPLIPSPTDQNRWAHWRNPMDMMRQG